MPRTLEFLIVFAATLVFALPMILIAVLVKASSRGPALYWSNRVGQNSQIFAMPKFRSMRVDTPTVATHLLTDGQSWLTPIGAFLRYSSLDELPQLWCILNGRMSIVGPRPALFNQADLIEARTAKGIDKLRPGLTGWAQINGRDELTILNKVTLDEEYLRRRSFAFDCRIILLTIRKVVTGNGISH